MVFTLVNSNCRHARRTNLPRACTVTLPRTVLRFKCSYCAFFSHAPDGEMVDRFVAGLVRELELVADDLTPQTIFFGGGTPSILNLRQWEMLLEAMRRLGLDEVEEWTVECNPATVSADKQSSCAKAA